MTDICKMAFGAVIGVSMIASCGSAPSTLREYLVDVKAQMLRGPKPEKDKPLSFCESNVCYAYEDEQVRKIKKYIIQLEQRLKECQK